MAVNSKKRGILSTYPSREWISNIYTGFSKSLDEVDLIDSPKVIAISDSNEYNYSDRVIMEISQHDRESYIKAAKEINKSDIELVVIEHGMEYLEEQRESIFGFCKNLEIPFVTTLHTMLQVR